MVSELTKHHEVWVLTRMNNRPAIEAELEQHPLHNLHFIYCDLPIWARWWQQWEVHIHYSLWQLNAYQIACQLHEEIEFDLTQHVTYGRYCSPSFLAFLPIPFVWGPVGGGESAPYSFWREFGLRGLIYEVFRSLSRSIGEQDPFVKITARRSVAAIVTTAETAARVRALGSKRIEKIPGQTGINQQEIDQFEALIAPAADQPVRFLSLGRLLHWKGFHLGIRAFAQTGLETGEYWILGDGPERSRLIALAQELGVSDRVRFPGSVPRHEALTILSESDVLVHPSLHDFSPTVCLEAMAAGRPVLCLSLGGPAVQITEATGIQVSADNPEQAVRDLAAAMSRLAADRSLRLQMGQAGQQRVKEYFAWDAKGEFLSNLYAEILDRQPEANKLPIRS